MGGTGDRPAITAAGRTVSYRQLAGLIEARGATLPDNGEPVPAGGSSVLETLVALFAAAEARRPVLVADPGLPAPSLAESPPGTFLVVVTSGTSGAPRPVLRTAASWVTSFDALTELTGLTDDDRVLLTGPLHSTLHLFAAVHALALGAELTDRAEVATAVHAVPAALAALLRTLPVDSPLRLAVVAGSALSDELAAAAAERGITVDEYYGAAELSFVGVRRWPDPLRPFPGAQVQIRRDNPSGPGQIWVRSPYLATGYPPGCAGPLQVDRDGFATVGDLGEPLGRASPLGAFRVLGRGDAAITTGGATVLAEDIERVIGALGGVAAVAVVGVPHEELGEIVTAVLEPVPGADLSAVRRAARRDLHGPSLPRRWLVADALPRTPGGKVRRGPVAVAARSAASRSASSSLEGLPHLRPLP